jgi:hypothetical protein
VIALQTVFNDMARGRPRLGGTDEERAEARRAHVRLHVQAYRQRQKEKNNQYTIPAAEKPLKILIEDPGRKLCSQLKQKDTTDNAVVYNNHKMLERKTFDALMQKASTPCMQFQLDQGPAYRGPFFDALIARYLPDPSISSGVDGRLDMFRYRSGTMPITCSTWLLSACESSTTSGADVLSEAMLSMALGMVGAELNDIHLLRSAMHAYQRALIRVQKGLSLILSGSDSPDASQDFLPLSCMACTLTELLANRSIESASRHLDGIALLIEKCGIVSLESPNMRAMFYEHRGVYIALCFLDRRSCFYAKNEWMHVALNDSAEHATSYYQTLIDIAYLIPELMEEYDSTGLASIGHLHQMLQRLRQFHDLLDYWKRNFEVTVNVPLVVVKETDSDDLFPNEIHFAAMGAATSLLYYYAFKIYLNQMIIDIAEDLALQGQPIPGIRSEAKDQALGYARRICRSLPYCFEKDKGALGKLISMFPFDSAWQTFVRANDDPELDADYGREVDFCRLTARRYEQAGITLFRQR